MNVVRLNQQDNKTIVSLTLETHHVFENQRTEDIDV